MSQDQELVSISTTSLDEYVHSTFIDHVPSVSSKGTRLIGGMNGNAELKTFNDQMSNRMTSQFINKRKIGICQIAFYAFFTVAGGPFGLELCISSGGPFLTFIGLLILPIIFELPLALMTSELSTMMPQNGGNLVWIIRGFGPFAGWMIGFNNIFYNLFNIATFPSLILLYYHSLYPNSINGILQIMLQECIVILGFIVNLFDARKVGNITGVLTLILFIPFIFGLVLIMDEIDINTWLWGPINTDGTHFTLFGNDNIKNEQGWDKIYHNLGKFLSVLLWFHASWDCLSSFGGEVKNPQKTYPIGMIIAMIIIPFSYFIPLITTLAIPIDINNNDNDDVWQMGYFASAFNKIEPHSMKLGVWVAFVNIIANFGLYISSVATSARIMQVASSNALGNGDDDDADNADDEEDQGNDNDSGINTTRMRLLPPIFGYIWNKTHSPIISVLFETIFTGLLQMISIDKLIETSMTFYIIILIAEWLAFLRLRYIEQNTVRPYTMPGGIYLAWFVTCLQVFILIVVAIFTVVQSFYVLWVVFIINLILFCLYFVDRKFGLPCGVGIKTNNLC